MDPEKQPLLTQDKEAGLPPSYNRDSGWIDPAEALEAGKPEWACTPPFPQDMPAGRKTTVSRSAFVDNAVRDWEGKRTVLDAMTYTIQDLITWKALTIVKNTQWAKSSTWIMSAKLFVLSVLVALSVVAVAKEPAELKTSKFNEVGSYLNVFVGLLLGFFMSSSMNRWYASANGFMELFDSIRNLQMQLFALGVPSHMNAHCVRYGLVSAKLLAKGLNVEALPPEERARVGAQMWADLDTGYENDTDVDIDGTPRRQSRRTMAILKPHESAILQTKSDPAEMMWIWVASYIGRMAQDGVIPNMSSPTYGRIMSLAQDAHSGIVKVRANIQVQAPFIYIHMLSTLVHINNIINALTFGITAGAMVGTWLNRHYSQQLHYQHTPHKDELVHDAENMVVCFFFSVVGPFLYQALLEVSVCIAQPFANQDGQIPTDRLLKMLEHDLADGFDMASALPGWEPPCYQAKS